MSADTSKSGSDLPVTLPHKSDKIERPSSKVSAKLDFVIEGPGSTIGPYKLLQVLGEGGMGAVFMAEQERPVRRLVALKIIKPGMDSREVTARFEAERQALAMMDHPNIAKVHEAGLTPSGRPYFVMELVKGVPITRFCEENRLTPPQRLALFIPVCHAVQHAHQKGIIHRDLKPSNILVAMYDDVPVPKVIDFGVAKATSQRLTDQTLFTQFGSVVGTLEYMSPEQAKINALDIDTRSDIYSLGVILYELLTGNTPLQKERAKQAALDEVLRVIREEEPLKPSTQVSSSHALPALSVQCKTHPQELMQLLRGELDWIVMKALEKDRSRRYDSANGLARDIQRFLADEPVEACPPSLGYQLRKTARRHKKALVLAAVIAVLLVCGIAGVTWQAVRASLAEADARQQRDAALQSEKLALDSAVKASLAADRANRAEKDAKIQRDDAVANARRAAENETTALENAAQARENALAAQKERDNVRAAKEELRHALYLSQLNLVQNAWNANKIDQAVELLRPRPLEADETDLHSFEWHYWNRLLNEARATAKLPEKSRGYFFNADATRIGSPAGKIWETAGGKEVFSAPGYQGLALSADGNKLAAIKDGELVVFDISSGQKTLVARLADFSNAVTFDSQAKRLAVTTLGKSAAFHVWDLADKREILNRPLVGEIARPAVCSPDGQFLAIPTDPPKSPTRRIRVWNVNQNKEAFTLEISKLARPIGAGAVGYLSPDRCVAYSPDGTRLATLEWGADENVCVWDARTGQYLFGFTEVSGKPAALAFSPQGDRLAVLGWGKIVSLWNLPANPAHIVRQPTLFLKWPSLPDREVCALGFSDDGRRLLTAEINGSVRSWDLVPPPRFVQASRIADKKGRLPRRHLSSDGRYLATAFGPGEGTGELQIWDEKGNRAGGLPFGVPSSSESFFSLMAFHPRENLIATVIPGDDPKRQALHIWDVATAKARFTIPAIGDTEFGSAAFTGDGQRLAALIAEPPHVRFWSARTGRELFSIPVVANAQKLAVSPDGKRLALVLEADDDKNLRYELATWDTDPPGQPRRTLLVAPLRIEQVAFSPDGKWIAAAIGSTLTLGPWGMRTQMEVKLWDAATGRERFTLRTPSGHLFRALAFSPDGRRLATAENDVNRSDHVVKLWDVRTGREVLTLRAEAINQLAFSPDGYRLCGQLLNPTPRGDLVQVWDVAPRPE